MQDTHDPLVVHVLSNCAMQQRTETRRQSRVIVAQRDISFFGPKSKTCVFTGRSSDSASSPRPPSRSEDQRPWPWFRHTAAVLPETSTPFPILMNAVNSIHAPVNTLIYSCQLYYTILLRRMQAKQARFVPKRGESFKLTANSSIIGTTLTTKGFAHIILTWK